MTSEIIKYLQAMDGTHGCATRYERAVCAGFNNEQKSPAYLAGWYSALLRELIRMIGKEKVMALAAAHAALEQQP